MIKTDSNGNKRWNVTIPTSFQSGQPTTDGGFVIAGSTSGDYNGDLWLIKFGSESLTPHLKYFINGGLGVNVKVTNNETINLRGILWQMHVEGGIFGLINYKKNGAIDLIIGKSKSVETGSFLGFGGTQITVNVGEEIKTEKGTHFFFFTLIKNNPLNFLIFII